MKLSIEKILDKAEELDSSRLELRDLIKSLDLTPEQMELLADHENEWVRYGLSLKPNITEELMIKLSNDEDWFIRSGLAQNPNLTENLMVKLSSEEEWRVSRGAFSRLKSLNYLKKEELEKAYDLIMKSKHIGRENFEETFDYIIEKFPELSELAKMFKKLIFKLKKDLK